MPKTQNETERTKETTKSKTKPAKGRGGRRLRREARQDIRAAYGPIYAELQRQQQAIPGIYGALQGVLGSVQNQYQQGTAPLMNQYQQGIQGLGGLLGGAAGQILGGAAGQEAGLAGNLLGNVGAGGMERLTGEQQRALGYMGSVKRQGGLEELQRIRDIFGLRREARTQQAKDFLAHLNELRREATQTSLSSRALGLQKKELGLQYPTYNYGGVVNPPGPGKGGKGGKGGRRRPQPGYGQRA